MGSRIGGSEYSDVESSGNIIKISSKESDASYLMSRNQSSQDDQSEYTDGDIQVIDGASSFHGSDVSGTMVQRIGGGGMRGRINMRQKSTNLIVDDYQSQGYGNDSEMDG